MNARRLAVCAVSAVSLVIVCGERPGAAAPRLDGQPSCSLAAVELAKARFESVAAHRRFNPPAVSIDAVRAASDVYITLAEACYDDLYGAQTIDDGGLTAGVEGASPYALFGTKWGAGTPYSHEGVDENGPRLPGGVVSYSFMTAAGVDMDNGTNTPLASLPTYAACFVTEIQSAFAAWSAVADIQFAEVSDSGHNWNALGAAGDIRIGAHGFTPPGPGGILAHGYYPPAGPAASTGAGDIHFDADESWSCVPGDGVFDIGIVATHEIGHAVGLDHEARFMPPLPRMAMMNPFYDPTIVATLLGDDINGAENIYGSKVGNSPDAIVDFGPMFGAYVLNYGVGYSPLHSLSPEQIVTGDLDGNGIDEIVADFGPAFGVYARMNMGAWVPLHSASPTHMAVGDIDSSGRDDVVMNFAGAGLWGWMNHSSFAPIHSLNASVFAIGNLDDGFGADIVATFPGAGVWRRRHLDGVWVQMHVLDAAQIVVGDFDETSDPGNEADDVVLAFAGAGLHLFRNPGLSAPAALALHGNVPERMAAGDMDGGGDDELVADFGAGVGLYVFRLGVGWTPLLALTTQEITLGDLDGNGRYELIGDFGASGLWAYVNNTSWVQLHPLSPEGLAVGDLN